MSTTTVLTWNERTGRYECQENGKHIEVDGDEFAETLSDMKETYMEEGMSEEQAYDKAFEELINPSLWLQSTPMAGVFIDGVPQD